MNPAEIIPLIDLTNLDENATDACIVELCEKASTPVGTVAAICIYPRFISLARQYLKNIPIATVINFPQGTEHVSKVIADIQNAILLGADEIDVVIPYHFYFSKERSQVQTFLSACRDICSVKLKMILETGALGTTELIAAASTDAIEANVDFIKTSTGKIPTGATPEAAAIMLAAIKNTGGTTGFKASGGIRTIQQAMLYTQLAETILGKQWTSPKTFRFGVGSKNFSPLLNEILLPNLGM